MKVISIETTVGRPVNELWTLWTEPEHIVHWNFASDEWHCPSATNDLRPGGRLSWRMEARDGSMGFDFSGEYETLENGRHLSYLLDDGRRVKVDFEDLGKKTRIKQEFEAEPSQPADMQRAGWQAILNNFRKYAESNMQ